MSKLTLSYVETIFFVKFARSKTEIYVQKAISCQNSNNFIQYFHKLVSVQNSVIFIMKISESVSTLPKISLM